MPLKMRNKTSYHFQWKGNSLEINSENKILKFPKTLCYLMTFQRKNPNNSNCARVRLHKYTLKKAEKLYIWEHT